MQITLKKVWIATVVLLSFSILWFLFGVTAFFQLGDIVLIPVIQYFFAWAPALVFVIVSVVWIIEGKTPRVATVIIALILAVPISFILILNTNLNGWIIPFVTKDWLQTTEDGKYEYRIELVNRFQRNDRTRLYIKDLSTGKERTMRLRRVSTDIFGGVNGQGDRTREPRPSELMSTLIPAEKENVYVLTTAGGHTTTVVLEICTAKWTVREVLREIRYRSQSKRVNDENDDFYFSYSLQLTDTHQNGKKTDISVLIYVSVIPPEGGNSKRHTIALPINKELLEKKELRRQGTRDNILWVTLEATDTPGQFVVQTTEDLSTDVTLTFLVDVELGVIG
jgi:hypothetical protein